MHQNKKQQKETKKDGHGISGLYNAGASFPLTHQLRHPKKKQQQNAFSLFFKARYA